MKNSSPRWLRLTRRPMIVFSLWTIVTGAIISPAQAVPPFPIYSPKPPAPLRVEMAPPRYGLQQTKWKPWPGQAELLEEARAIRERRQNARRRTLEEVLEAQTEDEGADSVTAPFDLPPGGLGTTPLVPGVPGEDASPALPLFDDGGANGGVPGPPTQFPPQNPAPAEPVEDTAPADDTLPTDDAAPVGDDAAPDASERAGLHRGRSILAMRGQWRSAGGSSTQLPSPALEATFAETRPRVAPADHQAADENLTPGEPQRVRLPANARSLRNHATPDDADVRPTTYRQPSILAPRTTSGGWKAAASRSRSR